MLDIKEVYPEFQKLQKTDNCIVIVLKTENKIAITSPVSIIKKCSECVEYIIPCFIYHNFLHVIWFW